MQIRLIDHKIGETFVYNNNFDIKDKQSPKIHFEIDFIPHLRSYISDDSLPIKEGDKNKEIQQLKDQQKQELDEKNKEIDQLKKQKTKEIDQKSKEIQQLKRELELKNKEIQQLKRKSDQKGKDLNVSLNKIKMNIYDTLSYKNFEKIEEIDSGASSTVYKVAMKTIYALKEMKYKNKTIDDFKRFLGEYEHMNLMDHPNILKSYGFYFGDKTNAPSIILEYCPQNLDSAIKSKSFSKIQIVCYIYQIIEGIKYIHF